MVDKIISKDVNIETRQKATKISLAVAVMCFSIAFITN